MAIPVNSPVAIEGATSSTGAVTENGVSLVLSSNVEDIVTISQAAYTALGAGRPANRLYLITS